MIKQAILNFLLFVVIMAMFFFIIKTWAETPLVQFDISTKQCVKVYPEKSGDCANLPSRYTSEWVKKTNG